MSEPQAPVPRSDGPPGPLVFSHRACAPGVPENSRAGIEAAGSLGVDGVEIDVRATRDGSLWLQHDAIPWRTLRAVTPFHRLSAARVARLRLRNGEPVLTLEDALCALAPGLMVVIDVKHPQAAGLVARWVAHSGPADRCLLWSSYPAALRAFREHAPGVEAALLRRTRTEAETRALLDDAAGLGAAGVNVDPPALDDWVVEEAADRGLRLYTGFQSVDEQERVLRAGPPIAGFTTDHPVPALALLGRG
ncbi:MAG: glycerophosphodiester phosphodiesterase [Actinobacteria bacterium]|nr:glycerophosphodiester phosphodiesterase [Actinomycetota bacterium]